MMEARAKKAEERAEHAEAKLEQRMGKAAPTPAPPHRVATSAYSTARDGSAATQHARMALAQQVDKRLTHMRRRHAAAAAVARREGGVDKAYRGDRPVARGLPVQYRTASRDCTLARAS